ncbi:3315_t:CDS:2 [Diversispora eburnea]|uniref:3315_t:CDS:1 n=1 Tax=Diversispora eburnea TaxID=1213867 RepID=A0A9N8VVV5_9GLOM|nr:3315_t:CDS:2 [Diversispora eburnea]
MNSPLKSLKFDSFRTESSVSSSSSDDNNNNILESPEEYEQNCLLFPTYATKHKFNDETEQSELTDDWFIRVRGRAFSTPKSSKTRAFFLKLTTKMTGIQKSDSSYELLESRTSLFWTNNLSDKEFTVKVVGLTESKKMALDGDPNDLSLEQLAENFTPDTVKDEFKKVIENIHNQHKISHLDAETSSIQVKPNSGKFSGEIIIPQSKVQSWLMDEGDNNQESQLLRLEAFQNEEVSPVFGVVNLVEPEGISVISDIDDTIKETAVLSGPRAILANTFLQPFKDVPGMAKLYRFWYDKGVKFHYVSNSPWQLLPMLRSFFNTHNFPPGSAHLKFYDGLIRSARDQRGNPTASKFEYIREILKDFPKRKFILIGDSGEHDPDIYAEIAEKFPNQIIRILIRDVTTPHLNNQQQRSPTYSKTLKSTMNYFRKVYSSSSELKVSTIDNKNNGSEKYEPEYEKVSPNDNKNNGSEKYEFEYEKECVKEFVEENEQVIVKEFEKECEKEKCETSSELSESKETSRNNSLEESKKDFHSRAFQKFRATNFMKQISSTIKSAKDAVKSSPSPSPNGSEQCRDVASNPFEAEFNNINTNINSENSTTEDDFVKSPRILRSLDIFDKRMEVLQQSLPEGLFSTFSDPTMLEDDIIINKELKLI